VIVSDYFTALERGLRNHRALSHVDRLECLASDKVNGLVRCRATFWDDSYLDVFEAVSTELGYPVRIRYAYTYVRQGVRVFRYDNAPHHPEIITHPHHKHLGSDDRLAPTDQPTLGQVLAEIEAYTDLPDA